MREEAEFGGELMMLPGSKLAADPPTKPGPLKAVTAASVATATAVPTAFRPQLGRELEESEAAVARPGVSRSAVGTGSGPAAIGLGPSVAVDLTPLLCPVHMCGRL